MEPEPPAAVVHRSRDDGVGNLGEDGTRGPRHPAVDLCVVFARLEDVSRVEKDRLELLDQGRRDGEGHEDGKETRLEIDRGVSEVVERERRKETSEDVEHEFADDVVWGALGRQKCQPG